MKIAITIIGAEMAGLPRAMAASLDIQLNQQVTALRAVQGGRQIAIGQTRTKTRHLAITVPAPQAAALIGDAGERHRCCTWLGPLRCCTPLAVRPHDCAAWHAAAAQRKRLIVRWRRLVPRRPRRGGMGKRNRHCRRDYRTGGRRLTEQRADVSHVRHIALRA